MYTAVQIHLHDNAKRYRELYVADDILDDFITFIEWYVYSNPMECTTLDDWYTMDNLPYKTSKSQVIEEIPHELWIAWLYDVLGGNE